MFTADVTVELNTDTLTFAPSHEDDNVYLSMGTVDFLIAKIQASDVGSVEPVSKILTSLRTVSAFRELRIHEIDVYMLSAYTPCFPECTQSLRTFLEHFEPRAFYMESKGRNHNNDDVMLGKSLEALDLIGQDFNFVWQANAQATEERISESLRETYDHLQELLQGGCTNHSQFAISLIFVLQVFFFFF